MLVMIDNYDSFTYNLVQYLGELAKWVPVAAARTEAIEYSGASTHVTVRGAPGEPVNLTFAIQVGGGEFDVVTVACELSAAGTAVASVPEMTCA